MNVRKPVDYSAIFTALDGLMAANPPQMKLYCEIGKLVNSRAEKGAAVAAAEYLTNTYPDASGFFPLNLRRMREFYRVYEHTPEVLAKAMTIGWTQNAVILGRCKSSEERAWYIRAVQCFGWTKAELLERIAAGAHEELSLDAEAETCYTAFENTKTECSGYDKNSLRLPRQNTGTIAGSIEITVFCAV